jgi:ATP-binding cassette subfamily G (WHITE) protein 1
MKQLSIRNRAIIKREPQAFRAKFGNAIFSALLIIMLYWQVGGSDPTSIQNFAGSVFFWLVGMLFSNMFNTILIFQAERDVFLRENANQMYSIAAYYISKNTIELPSAIFFPLIQLLMIYWSVGYRSENWIPELFQVWLLVFLVTQCALSYGYFISCSVKNMESATAVAPLLTMPAVLFGGLFVNSNSYPAYLSWIKYTSPIYYSNCGILLSQWRTDNSSPSYNIALNFLVGTEISYTECVYAMIALFVAWRFASFIALLRSVTKF